MKIISKDKKIVLAMIAAWACVGAGTIYASVSKDLGEMKHALGWDSMSLKMVERDGDGRPTLERDSNPANKMERKTSYHSNGRKAEQTLSVLAKDSGKTLYTGKKTWGERGVLESNNMEDDAFNGDGKQMKGQITEKQYEHGRLSAENRQEYSVSTGKWGPTYKQTISYYKDGDMKERVTEIPTSDEKTREAWGERERSKERKETTQKWNSSRGGWD